MKPDYIYFEPRTGIVKATPIRSNFYVYRLHAACLAKVELSVANDSALRSGGLVYPAPFMAWLNAQDTKWDQRA